MLKIQELKNNKMTEFVCPTCDRAFNVTYTTATVFGYLNCPICLCICEPNGDFTFKGIETEADELIKPTT